MSTSTIDYDALAAQHGGSAHVDYDALASQHGGSVANAPEQPGMIQRFQDAFDKAAQAEPVNTSSVGGFAKSVANDLGAGATRLFSPLVHPLDAAVGTAKLMAAGFGDIGAQHDAAAAMVRPFIQNPSGEAVAAIPQALLMGVGAGEAPAAARAVEAAAPAGSVADAAVSLAKTQGAKFLPSLIDGPPESLITRAVKPGKNNVAWNTDVQKAMPLMKSAEQTLGKPIASVDDALQAAQIAKKDIWQQYQQRLGPAARLGAVIDGNTIADAMVSSIDRRTALQNPGLVARVKATANTYRQPIPIDAAEEFLQSANKDLNTYYVKNKVGRQVAENDPETASTVAEAAALRAQLYQKLDQVSGPGAAQLKQSYGALSNMEKELYGRQLVSARQNPESLSEQLSTVRGAGKIAKGVLTMSPGDVVEGAQNIAVSHALKARNTSDAIIARAFQKVQPAQPFPMPSSPRLAGLLQRGPIQMGASAEAGGTPAGYQPPPVAATTRAQRLGLLLPERTGGNILPYNPEMTGGERLAALMQMLRERQQLSLPSTVQPRQLPPSF